MKFPPAKCGDIDGMTSLPEKLREIARWLSCEDYENGGQACIEAANEIERLAAIVANVSLALGCDE